MKNIGYFFILCFSILFSGALFAIENNSNLPTENNLKAQLETAQKAPDSEAKTAKIEDLQTSLDLLKQIKAQQQMNQNLQTLLSEAESEIQQNSAELQNLKKQDNQNYSETYSKQALPDLQNALSKLGAQLQATQEEVNAANTLTSGQATVSERAQSALTENLKRSQELNKLIIDNEGKDSLLQRYELELKLIDLKNNYNQTLLKNNDQLVVLYQSRYALLSSQAQQQQQQLSQLQEVINQKNLEQSQNKVEQAAQAQQQSAGKTNAILQKELDRNTQLSQLLLQQTEKQSADTKETGHEFFCQLHST